MEFKLAVVCEDASIEPDGKMNLHHIFRQIRCPFLPYTHPKMVLACSIGIPEALLQEPMHYWVDFINPDGVFIDRVLEDRKVIGIEVDDPSIFSFTLELRNLTFQEPGDYQFPVFLEGCLVQSVDLRLRFLGH